MVHMDASQPPEKAKGLLGSRILRATSAIMLVQIVIRGFGLIEKSILGHVFGTSILADAYAAAKQIAFYLYQIVDQVVMHSFLPVFVQRLHEEGEEKAWRLASTTINLIMLLMAITTAVGIVFAPQILPFFVPEWFSNPSPMHHALVQQLILLTRVMLVAMIFLSASSFTYCLLNSYKQFALPASADLALKGTVLVFAILFAKSWGPYALALGFVFGSLAKVAVHCLGLRKHVSYYRPTLSLSDPGVKKFALLALPLLVGVLVSEFRQFMDLRFISHLPSGCFAALNYAKTLTDTPVGFIPFAFGIALFPFIADIAAAGDRERLRSLLMLATRMMIMIFLPLTAIILVLREPLVLLFFSHKSMLAAEPLQIYALGMLIGALEIIVLQFYFAMSDTFWPTVIGVVIVPLHITMSYLGVFNWKIGVIAIPLALLISKGTKVVVLYALIRKRLGTLEGMSTLRLLGHIVLALAPMLLLLWLMMYLEHHLTFFAHASKKISLSGYTLISVIGLVLYFTILHAFKVNEALIMMNRVKGQLSRLSRRKEVRS